MSLWKRIFSPLYKHTTSQERKVLKVQMVLLFVLSTFLYIGFPGTREWRRQAEEEHMQTIIRGWDGLAWYTWLAAAPAMLMLVRRFPAGRGRIWVSVPGLALGSVSIYLVVTHVRYVLSVFPDGMKGVPWARLTDFDTYAYNTFGMLPLDLLTYSGFFAVSFAVNYYYKHRQRAEESLKLQIRAARLESELSRAELAALRGQLHPHFLFNSFNALATLVRQKKNDVAVEIIAQLSALLRLAIERIGFQEVTLRQELDFIQRYLDLEQVRFGDKLRIDFQVEPEVMEALVPNILLQPIVENAIKHGISQRTTSGLLQISAARKFGRLEIKVINDGPDKKHDPQDAINSDAMPSTGIGEANTRARLEKLFGENYLLERQMRPEGGAVVVLDLPWRLAPVSKIPA
ncbi:sensor histidine kinase [Oleiharenicola lentus]|uniref:sensor histidine kinase n=1 Tax=Oleiharenicola lentus TaxID=2508720 RepID=UPI003F6611E9